MAVMADIELFSVAPLLAKCFSMVYNYAKYHAAIVLNGRQGDIVNISHTRS